MSAPSRSQRERFFLFLVCLPTGARAQVHLHAPSAARDSRRKLRKVQVSVTSSSRIFEIFFFARRMV